MATGDFYVSQGTTINFLHTAGDIALTLTSLAANAGRVSAPCDLTVKGDGAGPGLYGWGLKVKHLDPGVIGEAFDIYLALSDKTNDFNISQSDAAVGAIDSAKGAMWIGQVIVNEAGNNTLTAFGEVFIPAPQVQVIVWNGTADALTATGSNHAFYLWPLPYNEV